MSFNYTKARSTAKKIIKKYGNDGTVVTKGTTGGFDSSGDPKADVPDSTIYGIITPVVKFKTAEIDGETIKKGDGWVFFHSNTEVVPDMQTTINGETFRVKGVGVLSSVDDIEIYQRLHLRK